MCSLCCFLSSLINKGVCWWIVRIWGIVPLLPSVIKGWLCVISHRDLWWHFRFCLNAKAEWVQILLIQRTTVFCVGLLPLILVHRAFFPKIIDMLSFANQVAWMCLSRVVGILFGSYGIHSQSVCPSWLISCPFYTSLLTISVQTEIHELKKPTSPHNLQTWGNGYPALHDYSLLPLTESGKWDSWP